MTPLHASWLVKACIILHNRCIDWGLRKLKRGQNCNPEHEMNIQVRAHMHFTMYNREIAAEDLPDEAERYGATNEGIVRRAQYVFKNYGRPTPQQGVLGWQRGRGRGRGQEQGRGRRAADAQEHIRGPIRGGRVERRGCGQAGAQGRGHPTPNL